MRDEEMCLKGGKYDAQNGPFLDVKCSSSPGKLPQEGWGNFDVKCS